MNVSQYHTVLVLSGGDYRFVYTNCCRGMLSNASSATNSNFTIGLDYKKTTTPNSSPVLLNFLPSTWTSGTSSQTMMYTFDMDGDSNENPLYSLQDEKALSRSKFRFCKSVSNHFKTHENVSK